MRPTVFLDLDDTILDFHKAERIAIAKTFREFGIEPTEEVLARYHVINKSCWERLETGEWTRDQVLVRRFEILRWYACGKKLRSKLVYRPLFSARCGGSGEAAS